VLFQYTWQYVTNGQKKQTRRLVQAGDISMFDESNPNRPIIKVIRTADAGVPKTLYEVGQTHAVQPGIGKKTVGHIRLTAIRRQHLQDLNEDDVLQEMPSSPPQPGLTEPQAALQCFIDLWSQMYPTPGSRWEDNPEVWVLHFESALPEKPAFATRSRSNLKHE
jgi:hypothetical protein